MVMSMQNKKGFTIVELVIVIAVIAVLAAVLIPTFADVISKAKDSLKKTKRQVTSILSALKEKYSEL